MRDGHMQIEVPNADIVDKTSILMIKLERVRDAQKLENIKKELESILPSCLKIMSLHDDLFKELKSVNEKLWDIEDEIRQKEAHKSFDDKFISLARAVYLTNDRRSKIKQAISLQSGSRLQEEKFYKQYY
jgi:peptidoglycan hydrolase CwlO-like protein